VKSLIEEFDQIVAPVERQMMQTVWHVLGNVHDAEDALQDALTIIVKRWKRVAQHINPRALIVKICAECAYDHLRRKLRETRRHQRLDDLDETSCDRGPAEELSQQELRLQIMSAISKLSRNQAVAFLLRNIQEQSYDDIAAALGCSVVTARKHVGRARQRLSVFLHQLAPHKGTVP
jgi:RNA polymerase sigma-70 factor (ECF subfamily)